MVVGLVLKFKFIKHFFFHFGILLLVFKIELISQHTRVYVFIKAEMCPVQAKRQVYSFT